LFHMVYIYGLRYVVRRLSTVDCKVLLLSGHQR